MGWNEWSEFNDRADRHISERLVELAGVQPGSRVLDIAAGYGEPALTAARKVGPDGRVVATDIFAEMLAFGRDHAGSSRDSGWLEAGESLERGAARFGNHLAAFQGFHDQTAVLPSFHSCHSCAAGSGAFFQAPRPLGNLTQGHLDFIISGKPRAKPHDGHFERRYSGWQS